MSPSEKILQLYYTLKYNLYDQFVASKVSSIFGSDQSKQ